jgi:hypothetical protein
MKKAMILLVALISLTITSCTDADVASSNLRQAADQFEIYRRVVFLNGITDNYILQVEGYCSITNTGNQLVVLVKMKDGSFLKHNLGLSDNVTYFSEQIESKRVSTGRYRVIFKPSVIVPNIDVE